MKKKEAKRIRQWWKTRVVESKQIPAAGSFKSCAAAWALPCRDNQ